MVDGRQTHVGAEQMKRVVQGLTRPRRRARWARGRTESVPGSRGGSCSRRGWGTCSACASSWRSRVGGDPSRRFPAAAELAKSVGATQAVTAGAASSADTFPGPVSSSCASCSRERARDRLNWRGGAARSFSRTSHTLSRPSVCSALAASSSSSATSSSRPAHSWRWAHFRSPSTATFHGGRAHRCAAICVCICQRARLSLTWRRSLSLAWNLEIASSSAIATVLHVHYLHRLYYYTVNIINHGFLYRYYVFYT